MCVLIIILDVTKKNTTITFTNWGRQLLLRQICHNVLIYKVSISYVYLEVFALSEKVCGAVEMD